MTQLALGSDPRADTLRRLQALLVQRFGHVERAADHRRQPEWVLVQGVIGARTRSELSNANADRLLADHGSWEAVAAAPVERLAAELASATYPNVVAPRLKAALTQVIALRGRVDLSHLAAMDTPAALAWLEALPGVGRKIAAGVLNASTLERPVMVLDGHHRRILQRMALVPPRADTQRAYDVIMPAVPPEWTAAQLDEHHMLMKQLGRVWCRPATPLCDTCPALALCPTGTARAPAR